MILPKKTEIIWAQNRPQSGKYISYDAANGQVGTGNIIIPQLLPLVGAQPTLLTFLRLCTIGAGRTAQIGTKRPF